ncbi:hypothetical protein IV487_01885 [Enterococcus saccharolyticus]|uniref:hypothetical protein n=1 Tax=Enterococcus saccharolyticus TaxID=41997 RepID=UPI001E297818|nr:hypothetical protein [Enterococcus saccharolyticus]MCD5001214.1 hypothetical protein [Enterococcus saccharolyticus]
MNEKITNLIQELQAECAKEKVTLACVVDDFKGRQAIAFNGTSINIALCGITLLDNLKKADAQLKKERPKTHVHVVDNEVDMQEILAKLFRGDSE